MIEGGGRGLFRITVPGQPVGKPRPKAAYAGGHPRVYTPSSGQYYEYMVRQCYLAEHAGTPPTSKAVGIVIEAYFALNKSDYDSKGKPNKHGVAKLSGAEPCAKKPDFDNIAKIVVDALNGIAWVDDCQIVRAIVSKSYAESPRVEVTAYEMAGE